MCIREPEDLIQHCDLLFNKAPNMLLDALGYLMLYAGYATVIVIVTQDGFT